MGRLIKTFSDSSYLEYDEGSFDRWCVYYHSPDGRRTAPTDADCFEPLKKFAGKYGTDKVYEDFVRVYRSTGKTAEKTVLDKISEISKTYGADALAVDIILSVLYVAMIAEENKKNTRLGKRIKRLGVHVLLWENAPVNYAADFMTGHGWREIANACNQRGF